MSQSKREIAFGLVIVGFVYLSLRGLRTSWVPVPVQDALFLMLLLLVVVLNVAGWWRLGRISQDGNTARWRKRAGLMGLVANTLAFALPFAAFLYGVYIEYLIRHGPVNGSEILDVGFLMPTGCAFAAFGVVAGALAPSRIRLAVILAGLVTCFVILAIPVSILLNTRHMAARHG